MSRVGDAMEILNALGLPRGQRNERSALVLLALAQVRPRGAWASATQPLLRIWDIMAFIRRVYRKDYAPNSRETIRRQTIHQFEQARIVDRNPDDPRRPTNSGKTVYRLTDHAAEVLKEFGTKGFDRVVEKFRQEFGSLDAAYQSRRESHIVPLTLPDGTAICLSPGEHNELQIAVIEEMGPRFAPNAAVLYVGDTAKKHVVCRSEDLARLSIPITEHDKLPDLVLYHAQRRWLFLVEAVTSHGPVSPKRYREMEAILANCLAKRIYVTAFPTKNDFRKHAADIAWETEVWIAENPEHMIHFNGPEFLGAY
jgi:hypothetical protein